MDYTLNNNPPAFAGVFDPPVTAAPVAMPAFITPEGLMAYCQSRMSSIDTQINTAFTQQQNATSIQQILAGVVQQFQNTANGTGTSNGNLTPDKQTCEQLEMSLEQAIAQVQSVDPNSPVIAQLEQLHDAVMATGSGPFQDSNGVTHGYYAGGTTTVGGQVLGTGTSPPAMSTDTSQDSTISAQEMSAFTGTLTTINSGLNSGSELQMIQLQSLMSQRQTAIELCTNLVQSLGDTTEKIAENIGH
jgi:hypothetical protein